MKNFRNNDSGFLGGTGNSSPRKNNDEFIGKPMNSSDEMQYNRFGDIASNDKSNVREKALEDIKKNLGEIKHKKKKRIASDAETAPRREKEESCKEVNIPEEVPKKHIATKKNCDQIADEIMRVVDFCLIDGMLHYYNSEYRYWKIITEANAQEIFRRIVPKKLRGFITNYTINEVYGWIKVEAPEITGEELSQRKFYLNFLNGAINWQTMERADNPQSLYFEYVLQCEIPDMEYAKKRYVDSEYKRYMRMLFSNDLDEQKAIEEIIGLVCSHIRDKKLAVFLYGPSNTGKSVLLNLMSRVVGREYTTSISFSQMSEEFAVAQLCGKWLNISGEISGATNKRLDILKSLTGNDPVTVCFKGKNHFEMRNNAFLLFACNTLPKVDVESVQSVFERILIFDCSNVVERSMWRADLVDTLFNEADIIMYRAIKGLRRLCNNNYSVTQTKLMRHKKEEYLLEYNSFIAFAQAHLTCDAEGEEASSEIQRCYNMFCRINEVKPLATNVWAQELQRMFPVRKGNITRCDRNPEVPYNARGYKGILLVDIEKLEEIIYPAELFHGEFEMKGGIDDA